MGHGCGLGLMVMVISDYEAEPPATLHGCYPSTVRNFISDGEDFGTDVVTLRDEEVLGSARRALFLFFFMAVTLILTLVG
jgi:hypothetical protein